MAASTSNEIIGRGTTAERLGYTPVAPSPVSGPAQGILFWDTDLQQEFSYDFLSAAWVSTAGAGSGTVTHTGGLTSNMVVLGNAGADIKTLAAGTAGQVLTMNGGATAAVWATPGAATSAGFAHQFLLMGG